MKRKEIVELASTIGQKYDTTKAIYLKTNEDLTKILSHYDIKDKSVLTVLASSDQALTSYYYGAKEIDTFDMSYTSLYYYFLKKWLILYKNRLYPSKEFITSGDINLYNLVLSINPESEKEKEAKLFWQTYMEANNNKANPNVFIDIFCNKGDIPYKKDIDSIKGFYDKPLSFTNFDLTRQTPINKKYDVLIVSNILEFFNNNESALLKIRNNIDKLLKPNGIAICSNKAIPNSDDKHKKEVKLLTYKNLTLYDIYEDYSYAYKKSKY